LAESLNIINLHSFIPFFRSSNVSYVEFCSHHPRKGVDHSGDTKGKEGQ